MSPKRSQNLSRPPGESDARPAAIISAANAGTAPRIEVVASSARFFADAVVYAPGAASEQRSRTGGRAEREEVGARSRAKPNLAPCAVAMEHIAN
jgi:hypothetical protein